MLDVRIQQEVLDLLNDGKFDQREIARMLNISQSSVCAIRKRGEVKHPKAPPPDFGFPNYRKLRSCLKCGKDFFSDSPGNRLCPTCIRANKSVFEPFSFSSADSLGRSRKGANNGSFS